MTSHPDGVSPVWLHDMGVSGVMLLEGKGLGCLLLLSPVELVKVSARDEVVREGLGVAHTLDTGVHEARVAQVAEASGAFLCGNW